MEKTFLTEEEKNLLLKVQQEENSTVAELGQIEYQIQLLQQQKDQLSSSIPVLIKRKQDIASDLQNKYGEGSIDLDSGEFVKNS